MKGTAANLGVRGLAIRPVFYAVLLSCWAVAHAQRRPFGPDEDNGIALDGCERTLDIRQVHPPLGTVDFTRGAAHVRISMVGTDRYEAQAFAGDVSASPVVNVHVQATTPNDVSEGGVCHDLNRDGTVDFVVSLWGHGNGLGASFYDRLVALSTPDGYRFWVVPTMNPSAADFVTLGRIEPIVMVTETFVQLVESVDRRSYSMYNLWAFRGGELVNADAIDDRFPKWVRWTFAQPNSAPARSVSDEQRRSRPPPRVVEAVP